MECQNQQVVHKRFGRGAIVRREENVIQVYFQDYGSRAFHYPEAFEGFLKAEDSAFAEAVQADLDAWHEAQQLQKAEHQLKVEAEIGEARSAARKRTTTPKRTTANKTAASE